MILRLHLFNLQREEINSFSKYKLFFYFQPRSSFSGFPGGGLRFSEVGRPPAQRPVEDDLPEVRGSSSRCTDSIPINVIHEKSADPSKHRYTAAGRNTTEIPTQHAQTEHSPRLERAHSEPPNKFNQRLNLNRPVYSTIPENGEGLNQSQANLGSSPRQNSTIKTSASAPSVPESRGAQPVPPPRKSPPRPNMNSAPSNPGPRTAVPTGTNVRHIPIFVEGRAEPIFNSNLSSNPTNNATEMSFPKPSDYYPAGVQRIRSRDESDSPDLFQGRRVPVDEPTTPQGPPPGPIPMGYLPSVHPEPPVEPTTPQGPPPGPIPMGYLPTNQSENPPAEVQSTQPCDSTPNQNSEESSHPTPVPPPPPIRNKVAPSSDHQECLPESQPSSKPQEPVANFIPIKVEQGRPTSPKPSSRPSSANSRPSSQELPKDEPKTTEPRDPKISKLETINLDVENLRVRISNYSGSRKNKEYLYLDDMLTKLLISLDGIDADGRNDIKQMRKESVKKVDDYLKLLDEKASD